MSSLRNAVKRITHKERAQPKARAHLGFLEKKKDYKKRAQDYHRKRDRVNSMKEKASMRNPDEFYFGMHNSEIRNGKHRKTQQARQEELKGEIGSDAVKIMKDQDLSYVRMQRQCDLKKAERLKSSLHFLGEEGPSNRKHTIFVDSKEEAEAFDVVKHFDTVPQLADRSYNRPRVETLHKAALEATSYGQEYGDEEYKPTEEELKQRTKVARKIAKRVARARSSAYGELEARKKRVATLELAEAHLVTEKLVAGKGRKRKIRAAEDGKPAQYVWSRKRLK